MAADAPAAFFSYSRDDSDFALRLAEDLKAAGAAVWIDQLDIEPGMRWDRAVETALNNCPRMLVILSPASVNSDNVLDEVSFALRRQKTVIPVLYRECDIPLRLERHQHIDFRTDHARAMKALLRSLGVDQPRQPVAPEPPAAVVEARPSDVFADTSKKLERERLAAAESAHLEEQGAQREEVFQKLADGVRDALSAQSKSEGDAALAQEPEVTTSTIQPRGVLGAPSKSSPQDAALSQEAEVTSSAIQLDAPRVLISPTIALVAPGLLQQFKASVLGAPGTVVQWHIVSGFGTITQDGLYKPPMMGFDDWAAGSQVAPWKALYTTIEVVAAEFPGASDLALVQHTNNSFIFDGGRDVVVSPNKKMVRYGQTQRFAAKVLRKPGSKVSWEVIAGPGTIDQAGVYMAPALTPPSPDAPFQPGWATIQATSEEFPDAFDIAVVKLI